MEVAFTKCPLVVDSTLHGLLAERGTDPGSWPSFSYISGVKVKGSCFTQGGASLG